MPRTKNIATYENEITLQRIKDVIMPTENVTTFLNVIFDSFKDSPCDCFTESYKGIFPNHRSTFVNGNYLSINEKGSSKTKRVNVDNLKRWAIKLNHNDCYCSFFNNVIECTRNLTHEQIKELCELFRKDKEHMPDYLNDNIQKAFDDLYYSYAVFFMILWSIYGEDQIHLLADISQYNSYTSTKIIPRYITPKSVFEGRDDIIDSIHQKFFSHNCKFVFLQGMGGSGKSECAKQYAQRYQDYYQVIIFAEYNKSLIELVNDNTVFSLSKPFISERRHLSDGSFEDDISYYKRKLEQIRLSSNKKTLIILDNIDYKDDRLIDFLTGFCHVIVTTRCNMQLDYPQETICIEGIDDINICRNIFSSYYGSKISDFFYVDKIIHHYSGHPMALELVANQMRVSGCTSKELLEIVHTNKEFSFEEGYALQYKTNKEQNMFSHICQLFEISNLSQSEIYVLTILSLLPRKGIKKKLLKTLCDQNNYSAINNLERLSWIRNLDGVITMHSLVKEVVFLTYKPKLITYRKFANNLMEMFSSFDFFYASLFEKNYIYEYIFHLYRLFPEPEVSLYQYYEWIELVLSHQSNAKEALCLAKKIYKLYIVEFGEKNFRTGRIICRIGCNYKNLLNFDEAKYYLEKGANILRNLEDKDKDVLRYISDVDLPLIDLYLHLYIQKKEDKYALLVQGCSEEAIRIRSNLKGCFPKIQTSLILVNCTLSRLFIYQNNLIKAEEYLNAALNEHREYSALDDLKYRYLKMHILITETELHIANKNLHEAKQSLNKALIINESYFSFPEGDSSINTISIRIKLAEAYLKSGDKLTSLFQYQELLKKLKGYNIYTELTETIKNKCEEIAETNNEKTNRTTESDT